MGRRSWNRWSGPSSPSPGTIEWSEACYCETPLQHERSTVYDRFFDGLTTEPVDGYQSHDGRPFLDYLDGLAS